MKIETLINQLINYAINVQLIENCDKVFVRNRLLEVLQINDWNDDGKGDNKGHSDHVGIVEKVSGDMITVIEGNMKALEMTLDAIA